VAALRSITANVTYQQQTDGVLMCLGKHGRHVDSLHIRHTSGFPLYDSIIRQLPPKLHLSSLHLEGVSVQLNPCDRFRGLLGAAAEGASLKHLVIRANRVLDSPRHPAEDLGAALPHLPWSTSA
jgi:hypothetical protein